MELNSYALECAGDRLARFQKNRPDVDVHTVTVILFDGSPVVTIVGTNQLMDDVKVEEQL